LKKKKNERVGFLQMETGHEKGENVESEGSVSSRKEGLWEEKDRCWGLESSRCTPQLLRPTEVNKEEA